ncbi:MAG: hypothetical protein U0805_10685 [Pirellulales bacterium]
MIVTYVVSLMLLGLSGFMLDMHRRAWRNAQQDTRLAENERRYALSQYRRRMQASGIIGVLGIAIGCGPIVPHEPIAYTIYVLSIAGACFAIVLLAAIDAWATRQHFARIRSAQVAAEVKLARELTEKAKARDELERSAE